MDSTTSQSRFLEASKQFLASGGMKLRSLIASWKQICDLPSEITSTDEFKVRETFRHINTFRNRFAHVPFPFEEMTELSGALADVTEQLFSIEPKPWQSFPDDRRESPLCGAIEYRGRRLRGNMAHVSGEAERMNRSSYFRRFRPRPRNMSKGGRLHLSFSSIPGFDRACLPD